MGNVQHDARRTRADERNVEWRKRTPKEQLAILKARLAAKTIPGACKKQLARLEKLVQP